MWQGWHDENQIRMRLERELKQLTTVFHRVVSERDSLKKERDELQEENEKLKMKMTTMTTTQRDK